MVLYLAPTLEPERTMPPGNGRIDVLDLVHRLDREFGGAHRGLAQSAPMMRRLPPPTAFLVSPVVASQRNSPSMTGTRQKCRSPNFFETCQPSPK